MLNDILRNYKIILASGSPRRQRFLADMGLDFEVRVKSVEEIHPPELKGKEISDYLAKLKASPFEGNLDPKEILITSDTVVWHRNKSLAKPKDEREACAMLHTLSNDWHEVITSVCFTTTTQQVVHSATTQVKFGVLDDASINHYIKSCEPFDKAGGYGIQEWIGLIGIEEIRGSYSNVVGLPTHLVYKKLIDMVG